MENGLPYDVYIKLAELDKEIEASTYTFITVEQALDDMYDDPVDENNLKMEPTEFDVAIEKWEEKIMEHKDRLQDANNKLETAIENNTGVHAAETRLERIWHDSDSAIQQYQHFLRRVEVAKESDLKAKWRRLQNERFDLLFAARMEQRAQFEEPEPKRRSGVRPARPQ